MGSSTSALRQSMSATLSPEAERLRLASKEKAEQKASASGFALRKANANQTKLSEGSKSQDSLGNPSTPGYDNIWKRDKKEEESAASKDPNLVKVKGDESLHSMPGSSGKKFVRLQTGWEQILLVQQKLCEKAKNIMTLMESPAKYALSKKAKLLMRRHQGCIVDVDIEEHRKELEHKIKAEKEAA